MIEESSATRSALFPEGMRVSAIQARAVLGAAPVVNIPKIAGGYGVPISGRLKIGREWVYKGKRVSYANANCPDGRLQAKVRFTFKDGSVLEGDFLKPCTVRGVRRDRTPGTAELFLARSAATPVQASAAPAPLRGGPAPTAASYAPT
jgi:hypothetical protein